MRCALIKKSNTEKTHQIELMRSSFQQASRVLVWPGNAADNSDIAMDFISSSMSGSCLCKGRLDGHDEVCAALIMLASRPWWNLVWCLQEVALPQPEPLLMCGEKTLKFDVYIRFCEEECNFALERPDDPSPYGPYNL